jgi:hypothetical protein
MSAGEWLGYTIHLPVKTKISEYRVRLVSNTLIAGALLLSLNLAYAHWMLDVSPNQQAFPSFFSNVGYMVFQFLHLSLIFAVYTHSRDAVSLAFKNGKIRSISQAGYLRS